MYTCTYIFIYVYIHTCYMYTYTCGHIMIIRILRRSRRGTSSTSRRPASSPTGVTH